MVSGNAKPLQVPGSGEPASGVGAGGCGDPEGVLSVSESAGFCEVCQLVLLWKSQLPLFTLIHSSHSTPLL